MKKTATWYLPKQNSKAPRHGVTQPAPRILSVVAVLLMTLGTSQTSVAQESFVAGLKGSLEAPPISSPGVGFFQAASDGSSLTYTLNYQGLAGGVTQAHIHFGQPSVNGGIVAFLCSADGNPVACPSPGQPVNGALTAANVQAIDEQGIAAGDFAALLRAMRTGTAYVNVHTDRFPGGEIRGDVFSGP
jgi:CHRD domain.